ncbi:MAG: hypothetical protein HYZ86_01740 [Candidatus Omnitrophica bacterium]|nr:hypothetical protein [Candidatus Omnitrophota bacterium]
MSIIHDALKKAQNGLQDKTPPPPRPGGAKPLTVAPAVLILLAAAVLTAGYVYRQGAPSPVPYSSVPKIEPLPLLEPKAEPRPEHADTLNIHGIMSDPNGNVVLIDNGIYAEGDEVQGVKIIKISLDGIVILKDGKEETIRVGQH